MFLTYSVLILDIEERKLKSRFIPFCKRVLYEINVDITNVSKYKEIEEKIKDKVKDIPKTNLVKINLIGEIEIEVRKGYRIFRKKI